MHKDNRELLLEIFNSGIEAVQPGQALLNHLDIVNSTLRAGDAIFDLGKGKIIVVGAGKGAAPMAAALENLLGSRIATGLIVVKKGHGCPTSRIEVVEASHPLPDAAGEQGAEKIMAIARQCGPDDLLVCLFTGGASSLLPAPAPGISLKDLQKTTAALLASGADIHELNAIRKHVSRIGGGQLTRAAGGARVLSIIVSDVVGDSLDTIASGPTAPDISTFAECLAIIAKYDLNDRLPAVVLEHLRAGAAGEAVETPKPGDPVFEKVTNVIVASNRQALQAAANRARSLGFETLIMPEPVQGEARLASVQLIKRAKEIAAMLKPGSAPMCFLAGGETTVTLKGAGLGGRNQEMALAASLNLENFPRICALFAGTDGTDGPTDAAGGFAFSDSAERMGGKGRELLENNDSYHALEMAGDLFVTGPTLTNVMDMAILLIDAPGI